MTAATPPGAGAVTAGDVVAVGHEIGRMRTDGTIIGRAEPYAKVFPSSRHVKRAVGVMAWAILEDIALDAHIDQAGRLVATTNVRRIADNLGVSKNTVATHLCRLRDAGFVLHEEGDHDDTGRYTVSRYVLDPSACVERFTHTPTRNDVGYAGPDETDPHLDIDDPQPVEHADSIDSGHPDFHRGPSWAPEPEAPKAVDPSRRKDPAKTVPHDGVEPCTNSWDTDPATVSQSVGHRELGHNRQEVVVVLQEQQRAREGPAADGNPAVVDRLIDAGITPTRATLLASRHPPRRIADAVDALTTQTVDNPAGWIITALDAGWDLTDTATRARRHRHQQQHAANQRTAHRDAADAAARHTHTQRAHSQAWAAVAATLLDEGQLGDVLQRLRDPWLPISTRSVRMTTAQVTGWTAAACHHRPKLEPAQAVAAALNDPTELHPLHTLPPPPAVHPPPITLDRRISTLLQPPEHADQPTPGPATPAAATTLQRVDQAA